MTEFLARLAPYLAPVLAGVVFGAAALWYVQGLKIDKLTAEHVAYVQRAEAHAAQAEVKRLETEAKWKEDAENAKRNAQEREKKLSSDLAAAARAADRLRNDVSALRERLADAPAPACVDAAATLGELFGECGEAYRDLAGQAQGHVNDIRTLTEERPR